MQKSRPNIEKAGPVSDTGSIGGKIIAADGVGSYFGRLFFRLVMHESDSAELWVRCERPEKLREVMVRTSPPGKELIACDQAEIVESK